MKPIGIFAAKWLGIFGAIVGGLSPALAQGPIIFQQPQSQIIAVGYPTTFKVTTTNQSPYPKVQWWNDQGPIPGATNPFVPVFGTQASNLPSTATYTFTNTQLSDAGSYGVTLSNSNGDTVSSNATLGVIPAYTFITMAGVAGTAGTNDGTGSAARFTSPRHLALDAQGNLFVTDFGNDIIRKVTSAGIVSTFTGTPDVVGTNDGPADTALFNLPHGIALDGAGNIFVTDLSTNYKGGTIRKITPGGFVTTIAGQQNISGTNDGAGGNALFAAPWGIAVDAAENVFVSDSTTIRKLTSADGTNWLVTTIAGLPGVPGKVDGTNSDARFYYPDGLAIDGAGRIFVDDEFNGLIREMSPSGTNWVVSTIGQFSQMPGPSALALGTNDNIYLAGQGEPVIFEMTGAGTNWMQTVIAGRNVAIAGEGTNDGTGITARFDSPHGIALDKNGNLFVADEYGNIRKGWSSDAHGITALNSPFVTGNQVQLKIVVTTGGPANFTLLQSESLGGPWVTNSDAQLITNIPGLFYQLIAPLKNESGEFYRLKQ